MPAGGGTRRRSGAACGSSRSCRRCHTWYGLISPQRRYGDRCWSRPSRVRRAGRSPRARARRSARAAAGRAVLTRGPGVTEPAGPVGLRRQQCPVGEVVTGDVGRERAGRRGFGQGVPRFGHRLDARPERREDLVRLALPGEHGPRFPEQVRGEAVRLDATVGQGRLDAGVDVALDGPYRRFQYTPSAPVSATSWSMTVGRGTAAEDQPGPALAQVGVEGVSDWCSHQRSRHADRPDAPGPASSRTTRRSRRRRGRSPARSAGLSAAAGRHAARRSRRSRRRRIGSSHRRSSIAGPVPCRPPAGASCRVR